VGILCDGLVSPSPKRPCNDVSGVDASLRETLGYPADFLDRPAYEVWRFLGVRAFVFLGVILFARCWMAAIMAKASMTSETWRCQPCQDLVSLWSSPNSFLAVSKLSSIAHRCPSVPLDADQRLDRGSRRAPCGEVGEIAVGDVTSDQHAARPQAIVFFVEFFRLKMGQLEVAPVMQARNFVAVPCRQTLPVRCLQGLGNVHSSAGDLPWLIPRPKHMGGIDAEYIAFAGLPQVLL
jgi:hypothetical protein